MRRLGFWHRAWRNHRRKRSFWQHPRPYWFPSGILLGVLFMLLLISTIGFHIPNRGASTVAAIIGIALALTMIALSLIRLYRRTSEWDGHRRNKSLISLVGLIGYVVVLA
ncbi:MAG TPA: hypothetical protein DEO92_00105 [Phycisphaerales bacterium]|nr:hypothetical protein [Phycisphaerales bacterium]